MKALSRTLMLLLALFALVAVGCGDDDSDNNTTEDTTTGTPDATDDATTSTPDATEDATTTDDATADDTAVDDTTAPTGACTNAADQAVLADDTVDTSAAGRDCGLGCLSTDPTDPGPCSATCVADTTGLSTECSACYGDIVLCSLNNCSTECVVGTPEECEACQTTAGCFTEFAACSGIQ